MKPLVTLALACALFSGVNALACYQCILLPSETGHCSSETTCPAYLTNCASVTEAVYIGDTLAETQKAMGCAAPAGCVSGSLNFGITRQTINTQCCGTHLCNSAQVPELPGFSPNGNTCFTCVGLDCTHTLECIGSEDRCIKASATVDGQTVAVKGCASHSFCSGSMNISRIVEQKAVDLYCCEGNMCNNALRIGKSVLFLLLVPLASFILFN